MMGDVALNDIRLTMERGFHDVCTVIDGSRREHGEGILDFALRTCCHQVVDGQGKRVDGGYVADAAIGILTSDGRETMVAVGDELFAHGGIVRILDTSLGVVRTMRTIAVPHIQSVYHMGPGATKHPWE